MIKKFQITKMISLGAIGQISKEKRTVEILLKFLLNSMHSK